MSLATSTLINGISVMAVDFVAALIGVWFLYRYHVEKRKLLPYVSILGFCWVAQYLGVFIDFWSLVLTGANTPVVLDLQISYVITPVSIVNSIWLGFSIFNPKRRKLAFYIYLATAVPFYIALFGWPQYMYVANATDIHVLDANGLLITTSLASVLLLLAFFYIISAIFVIGGGFFSLRKKVTGFERQRATLLCYAYVLFGVAAILETTTGVFGDVVLIIARVIMATFLVLIYLGFSAKSPTK